MRPRGAVDKAGGALASKRASHLPTVLATPGVATAMGVYPAHHALSTARRQARILVDVHPVPLDTKARNFSFLGPDRMDNLWKAHS